MNCSGTVTLTFITGSSNTGPASCAAFLNAVRVASRKAISEESTAW